MLARPVIASMISAVAAHLLDLVLPTSCYGCGGFCTSGSPLCWRCIERLEPLGPIDNDVLQLFEDEDRCIPIFCGWRFDPDGPLSRVIEALKYKNQPWLGNDLGLALGHMLSRANITRPGAVVPIPLHPLRQLERGYNQTEWIARSMARTIGSRLRPDVLHRIAPTATQTRLSREERWHNVRDAFEVSAAPSEQSILLVDDVITTGATIHAAALKLFAAGCTRISAASVALSSH